nr:zinc finger, CCHC-type [Tanacetum cinerariifolium]
MKDMLKQGIISYNVEHKDKCEICVQVKMKRKPFPKVDRQSEMLELMHFDLCELNGQLTRGGNRTAPYTPQRNGVAERKNRVLQDIINAMLVSANLPKNLSGEALLTACHRNMAKSSSAPRRSERARKKRNLDLNFIDSQAIIFLVEGDNENNVINKIPVLLNVEDAPKTYKEAITSRNYAFWKQAIDDEMDSLVSNNTWELSDLPPGSKAIGCRWVFRIKYHTDGSIQTFKARLVIQGFRQRQGVDYFDTYAPVATAFLNGDLDAKVYMKQPEGFVLPGHENKVCKLKKSLYGLKQAPKQWHDKFDKTIFLNGFTHNSSDRCIYSKFTKDCGVILCLYVDDILIVGTNMKGINETKKFLSSCFQMKDMNEWKYAQEMLEKFSMNQCNAMHNPIFPGLNHHPPGFDVYCTINFGIFDRNGGNKELIGFTDSDYASDLESTSGYVFLMSSGAVSWCSTKQTVVTLSTTKAEFIAAASSACQVEKPPSDIMHLGGGQRTLRNFSAGFSSSFIAENILSAWSTDESKSKFSCPSGNQLQLMGVRVQELGSLT